MTGTSYGVLYNSPLGIMEITASNEAVISIYYRDKDFERPIASNDIITTCIVQLDEYFAGVRMEFNINIAPSGTDFQREVWYELTKIPYGVTISYHELSRRLHNEKAIRAVGRANGKNPVSIIVPCHRVIGADGSLTGYGGGLWRKKWLLEHEAKFSGRELQMEMF